jgi:ketosteroid isomerase-like protein
MTADENVAAVQRIYEAFGAGDVEAILDSLADPVDWSAATNSTAAPWYGKRTTRGEVAAFFQELATGTQVTEFNPKAFTANDNGEVIVLMDFGGTVTSTDKAFAFEEFHYWRFNAEGKVERFLGSEDTAQMAAALTN